MEQFSSESDYLQSVTSRCVLPRGFLSAAVSIPFVPVESQDSGTRNLSLSLIRVDPATESFAGVFTRNSFVGAPVIIGRERMKLECSRGVIINNCIANVGVRGGIEDSEKICARVEALTGIEGGSYFPCSTGVVGWRLPVQEILQGAPAIVDRTAKSSALELDSPGAPLLEVAKGIMTTDTYPKVRATTVGDGRIVAIAKGAGMVEPSLATMLCFVLTDLSISRDSLRRTLSTSVEDSLNCISVDGEQSTSDTVLAFSSNRINAIGDDEFTEALSGLLSQLAEDIVRGGEGTSHVIAITVRGASDKATARGIGKRIVNSPLVKSAVAGNDPNVGRILVALGDYVGRNRIVMDYSRVSISIGGREVFRCGEFVIDKELDTALCFYLKDAQLPVESRGFPAHQRFVDIEVNVGEGDGVCRVVGSDLTSEYVAINSDYRS